MKIYKNQIEFFKSYVSNEAVRPILQCLFLDMSKVKEEEIKGEVKRFARLVATNGYCLGSIDVELSDSDAESYLIPYDHLEVSKHYLGYKKSKFNFVEVEKIGERLFYKTLEATIQIDMAIGDFPEYRKVSDEVKETEYTIKVGTKLLKQVVESHIKLGQEHILIKMSGYDSPIHVKGFDKEIISLVMPVRADDDEEKGSLQK